MRKGFCADIDMMAVHLKMKKKNFFSGGDKDSKKKKILTSATYMPLRLHST
jgi:hypothetical protein